MKDSPCSSLTKNYMEMDQLRTYQEILLLSREGENAAAEPIKSPAIAATEMPLPLMTMPLDSILQSLLSFNEPGNRLNSSF